MKSFDEIKKELREKIKTKQTELIESDINSEEYTNILNELELLNLEYKEILNLKGNNFVKKLEEYTKLKTKYALLDFLIPSSCLVSKLKSHRPLFLLINLFR